MTSVQVLVVLALVLGLCFGILIGFAAGLTAKARASIRQRLMHRQVIEGRVAQRAHGTHRGRKSAGGFLPPFPRRRGFKPRTVH